MKHNIILVILDGSRFDRIGISKEFSDLIPEGTFLTNVITAIPYTFGSLNVILTGKYGKENGVNGYYKMLKLKDSINFLPEILQNNGYFTSRGLISNKILSPRGFDLRKEFNEYEENLLEKHPQLIRETITNSGDKPFFLLLQYTGIHTATVTEVLKKHDWDDSAFYDKKVDNMKTYDEAFLQAGIYAKKIKTTIDELGINDNTILIFFTDHGTGVGERFGERNYGSFTYEETIRTFYHFIGPKIRKNSSSDKLLSTIDIMPTILEFCGIEHTENLPGESFLEFLIDSSKELKEKEFTFSETGALHGPYPSPQQSNVFCIKTPKNKLIYLKDADQWLFYNLISDPTETKNIYDENSELQKSLKNKLLEWINS
jgi:arylsulfatase A-like enzyme|tara:strand:+ start:767 stop:1882 length:1116 start_codon:yes stop_codon:yes gene_type:complete